MKVKFSDCRHCLYFEALRDTKCEAPMPSPCDECDLGEQFEPGEEAELDFE